MTTKKRPIHTIKRGRIKASIYENDGEKGAFYGVQISRIYRVPEESRKDGDNGWRSTTSFSRDDLPLVAKLADLAHSWIYEAKQTEKEAA